MEVKKAIKKIVALGIGTTMVGATLLGATADLGDFAADRSPFIADGAFDGIIVVGDSAAAQDVIGSVDIATKLQYASTTETQVNVGSATQINVIGDAKKIAESSNILEVSESLNSVKSGITGNDLDALGDGAITNSQGTYKYTQNIILPSGLAVNFALDPDDTTDTPQFYLKLDASTDANAYVYKVAFQPALKSRHSTAAADDLRDVEDKKITLLGKEYTVIDTDHTAQYNIVLKLMGGSTQDTIQEYETKTYTVNGVDYEVECLIVDDNSGTTKLKVNGEITDELTDGETYKLADGTEVGIKSVLANEGTESGGGDLVEFYLGASKIELADTATTTTNWGGTLKIGGETIDNVKLDIKTGSDAGVTHDNIVTISSIEVAYNASQDLYVPTDGKMSEVAAAAEGEEGNFILDGFDYEFRGLEVGANEMIELKASGDDNYKLSWTNKNGDSYNEEVIAHTGSAFFFGKYSGSTQRDLVTEEDEMLTDEEYFTVNKNKYSHHLQFKDLQKADDIAKIKDLGSGETVEVSYDANGLGYINLDGNRFEIRVDEGANSMRVDFDGDGLENGTATNLTGGVLYTEYGALINLGINESGAENRITVTSEEQEDKTTTDLINVSVVRTGTNKLDLGTAVVQTGAVAVTPLQVGSTDVYQAGTKYGMFYERDQQSSTADDQDKISIMYPDEQVSAAVFVTSGATTASTVEGGSGVITTTTVTPIEVGAAKLASEVSDITAVNAIVVGGPCANPAAATLMGNPANCAEGFTEGKAIIKLYENGDNVAMLVAGATAMDTRRAARVVANAEDYADQLVGMEVEVSGTSLSDITVGVPTPAALTDAQEDAVEDIVDDAMSDE